MIITFNLLSTVPDKLPTNCLSVFDHFVKLALKKLICFTPNMVHSPSKVHIVFGNYIDNQTFSFKQTKQMSQQTGEGKVLHPGNDFHKMPQSEDYKLF